ncbi:malonate decarboxylase holo-[acyl-carrier-protein] synthase [Actimicrobium antarcticum]
MPARHSLLWLSAAGWADARRQVPALHHAQVDRWGSSDWPLIVRRQEADCPAGTLCAGLALPPDPVTATKHRLPLRVAGTTVTRVQTPVALSLVGEVVPAHWRPSLDRLQSDALACGLSLQVFGSAALQAITGLPYLRATSDLDVLVQPATPAQLDDALALLVRYSAVLPLDGEIVFPSGDAVSWKEWRNAAQQSVQSRVLVKRTDGVALVRMDVLLATLVHAMSPSCPR